MASGAPLPHDGFWLQKETSGALSAFRQLNKSLHRGGRKQNALPGGRLQPLYKNHMGPPRIEGRSQGSITGSPVVPGISGATEDQMKNVIDGYTEDLPPQTPNTVRVYLSSNYTDMQAERNYLMRKAVPQLLDLCSEHNLGFELIDHHWGLEDDTDQLRGASRDMRRQTIAECQRVSVGAFFVALIGDSYGPEQMVTQLSKIEHQLLCAAARSSDLELIQKYYKMDSNAVPPVYIYQVPDGDFEEAGRLLKVLREAAQLLAKNGQMTEARANEFSNSALEDELTWGVFDLKDPRSHCVCYRREFQHIDQHLDTTGAATYVDIVSDENGQSVVDPDRQTRLTSLTRRTVQYLRASNYHVYYLQWSADGLADQEKDAAFQKYLEKLCFDFVEDMTHLILQGMAKVKKEQVSVTKTALHQEVLHHSYICAAKARRFSKQQDVLNQIQRYLFDPNKTAKPYVVYGQPGSGKSFVMAAVATQVKAWFGPDTVIVMRFLGTSSDSSSIYSAVSSVTEQIWDAYEMSPPRNAEHATTLFGVLTLFRHTIAVVSREFAALRPLYIVLDGLDQLLPHDESLSALWALRDLPQNIHVLMSTVPQIGQINFLGVLLTLLTDEELSTEIHPLSDTDAADVIKDTCASASRTLTDAQKKAILDAYSTTRQPLHLSLLLTDALNWTSDTVPTGVIAENTAAFVYSKLEALEQELGANLVKYYMAYVTTATTGIHEQELRELLTSNDDIISEIRDAHPLPGDVVSVPAALLCRIKYVLAPLIEERLEYGKTVLGWSHTDIYAAMSTRYQVIYTGASDQFITRDATNLTLQLHEDMVNRYLPERQEASQHSDDNAESVTIIAKQLVTTENLTMLQKLPMLLKVLLPMEGPAMVKTVVFFNLHWMMTKTRAAGLRDVLQDVLSILILCLQLDAEQVFIETSMWKDIELLYLFLRLAEPAVQADVDNLPVEILCRLTPFASEYPWSVGVLVESAQKWLSDHQKFLLPVFTCLPLPTDPMRYQMNGPTHVIGFKRGGSLAVMFSQRNGISIWHLSTGEPTHRFPVHPEQSTAGVICGRVGEFVVVGHYSYVNRQMELRVLSTDTGVELLKSHFAHEFEVIALDKQDKVLVVATTMQTDKTQKSYRCLLGVDVKSREIVYTLVANDVHRDGVAHILFLDDLRKQNKSILSVGGAKAKDLALWNLDSEQLEFCVDLGRPISHVRVHEEEHIAVCASADSAAILVVDLNEGELTQVVEDTMYAGITDIYLTQMGKHVVIATRKHGIVIHSLEKGTTVKAISSINDDNSNCVVPVTFTLDGKERILIVGCETGLVAIYLVATSQLITRLEGHTARVNTLHCMGDGRLLTAGADSEARVWNVDEIQKSFMQNVDIAHIMSWDGVKQFDEVTNAVSSDTKEDTDEAPFPTHMENISCMVLRNSGKQVITASYTGPLKVWDVETGRLVWTLVSEGADKGAAEIYLAYKERLLVAHDYKPGSPDTLDLKVWDAETGKVQGFEGGNVTIYTSLVFPSGDRLLTIAPSPSGDKPGLIIGIYDLFEMKCITTLHCSVYGEMNSTNLKLIGFSAMTPKDRPDTDTSSASDAGDKRLFAVLDFFPATDMSYFFTFIVGGKTNDEISMSVNEPIHLDTVSPKCSVVIGDGCCVTGSVDGSVIIWDVLTQDVVGNLYDVSTTGIAGKRRSVSSRHAHSAAVTCLALGSDGNVMATGGEDAKVKLWDLEKRLLLLVLVGHTQKITSLSVVNKAVVSGSADLTLRTWDTNTGHQVGRFFAHAPVTDVAMTTNSTEVMARLGFKKPRLILLKTGDL